MLPPDQEHAFLEWLEGVEPSLKVREHFSALNLTLDAEAAAPRSLFQTDVPGEALDLSTTEPMRSLWPQCAMAVFRIQRALRRLSLYQILGSLSCNDDSRTDEASVHSATAAFMSLRPLLPAQRVCLKDSLALLQVLRARHLRAKLVFGVKLSPFLAHCWLQTPTRLLNETPDRVRLFTPIWASS